MENGDTIPLLLLYQSGDGIPCVMIQAGSHMGTDDGVVIIIVAEIGTRRITHYKPYIWLK